MVQIQLVGAEDLAAKFAELADKGRSIADAAVLAAAEVIRDGAVDNLTAQGLRMSGTLARSIHVEPTAGQSAGATVGTNLEYAAIHEYGGIIEPKNVTFLHFTIDGQEVFTKGPVEIPARPYMRPAVDERKREAAQVAGVVAGRLIRRAVS